MRSRILIGLLFVAAVAAPAAAGLFGDAAPSRVIFPPQQLPLSFSHAEHLLRDKMDCAFCHENTPDSTSAADNNTPKEESCTTCHEIERDKPQKQVEPGKPDAKCDSCHPGYKGVGQPARVVVPTPNMKFNHKVHVSRKIRCQTCHGDLARDKVGLATRDNLPRMPLCLSCHDGKTAPSRCTTCHLSEPGGRVRTEYPEGELQPSGVLRGDAHDLKFRMEHARVASNDEAYCANCHKKEFCTNCHNGITKPMDFHGGDYISMHPIEARRNNPDCGACHRRQTFCVGCHERSGVGNSVKLSDFPLVSDPNSLLTPPGSFHPEKWLTGGGMGTRTGGHHSFQAERNIRACASCHEEDFCIRCHGGSSVNPIILPVNPHPPGFASSSKCKALAKKIGRMCLRCHAATDESVQMCL